MEYGHPDVCIPKYSSIGDILGAVLKTHQSREMFKQHYLDVIEYS